MSIVYPTFHFMKTYCNNNSKTLGRIVNENKGIYQRSLEDKRYYFTVEPTEPSEFMYRRVTFTGVEIVEGREFDYRDGKPEMIPNDKISMFKKGLLHNRKFPAQTYYKNGICVTAYWWINGNYLFKFDEWLEENNIEIDNLSDEDKVLINLKWDIDIDKEI